jgi:hypothetical protein
MLRSAQLGGGLVEIDKALQRAAKAGATCPARLSGRPTSVQLYAIKACLHSILGSRRKVQYRLRDVILRHRLWRLVGDLRLSGGRLGYLFNKVKSLNKVKKSSIACMMSSSVIAFKLGALNKVKQLASRRRPAPPCGSLKTPAPFPCSKNSPFPLRKKSQKKLA